MSNSNNDVALVSIDLAGLQLTQSHADYLHGRISAAIESGEAKNGVDILIRRVATAGGVPRLIVDRSQIYDALSLLLKERQ